MRPALALLAAALLFVGCGPARESAARAVETSIAPSEVTTKIVGATPKQETILREILAGLGSNTRIRSVRVMPAGKDAVAVDPHVTKRDLRGEWEVALLANAFAFRSREANLPRVAALFVNGEEDSDLDVGDPAEPRDPVSAEALTEQVVVGTKKNGARLVELQLLRPNNYALAVKLQVDDPASFLDDRLQLFLSTVPDPAAAHYDGLFIEVVDEKGKLAWSHMHSVSEVGDEYLSGYNRPDLAGCGERIPPFGGPPNRPPRPPCPADDADLQIESVPTSDVTTKILGGTPKQKAVLREILAGLGPTRIDSVQVSTDIQKEWRAPANAVGFDAKILRPDEYSHWQAWLVGDELGRQSLELGLAPVAYVGVNGDQSGGLDFSSDPSQAPLTRADADEVLGHVAEIARKYGTATRVRVLKPGRLAFAVYFRTAKPAEFLRHGLNPALDPLENSSESGHDGAYVKVVDMKGELVFDDGWVRPDLAGCSPYLALGPDPNDPSPPPCPAK